MPPQITIVWKFLSNFRNEDLVKILNGFGGEEVEPKNEHEQNVWKVDGLTIKHYKNKLVVQGIPNDDGKRLLQRIAEIDGLSLDDKNAEKFAKIFPTLQNAILCSECRKPSLIIEGVIEGLDIVFKKECGHKNNLKPPILMLNNRILPDMNILISNNLSRLIKLGFFVGFEIVIPDFIIHAIDQYLGPSKKKGASQEIENLRKLEQDGKISIFNVQDNLKSSITRDDFNSEEDVIILKIANLTNSILITTDKIFKERASLGKRPTIYIDSTLGGKIKTIEEVRAP